MPRKAGGTRRKRRTHKLSTTEDDVNIPSNNIEVPRSFVFRRGQVPTGIRDLVPDLRISLMPHTAIRLKERKMNTLKDYLSLASHLQVTHLWILSATALSPYLRLAKVPQGPTLTFRIKEYSLCSDVRGSQRRPIILNTEDKDLSQPPLLVMNNFTSIDDSSQQHIKLMSEGFKFAFPAIDVSNVRLGELRRVLLIHRDLNNQCIYIRHYILRVKKAGLSKTVRRIIHKKRVPKMGSLADVAQVVDDEINGGVFSSDSEAEGDEQSRRVDIGNNINNSHGKKSGSVVRLSEVGPRLTLDLIKIQSGICEGAVLYHAIEKRSVDQVEEMEERVTKRKELKRKRREQQEENVKRKDDAKKAKKDRRKQRTEDRLKQAKEDEEKERKDNDDNDDSNDDDDDVEGGIDEEDVEYVSDDE